MFSSEAIDELRKCGRVPSLDGVADDRYVCYRTGDNEPSP
jgi:hypothetical protein